MTAERLQNPANPVSIPFPIPFPVVISGATLVPRPELVPHIVGLFSEVYGGTVPLFHYPTLIVDAILSKLDALVLTGITFCAMAAATDRPEYNWLFAAFGGTPGKEFAAKYGQTVFSALEERAKAAPDLPPEALLPTIQSSLVQTVGFTLLGAMDKALAAHTITIWLHGYLRFAESDSPALATNRIDRENRTVTLETWIRGEEFCRACMVAITIDTLLASMRDGKQSLETDEFGEVAVPCIDASLSAIPAAVPSNYLPLFVAYEGHEAPPYGAYSFSDVGFGQAEEPVAHYLGKPFAQPLSAAEAFHWMDQSPGTERERLLKHIGDGFLNLGACAGELVVGEILRRTMRVCSWFSKHDIPIHNPPFERPSHTADFPDGLLFEARRRKAAVVAMLADFAAHLPPELVALDTMSDGPGIVTLGDRHWGPRLGYKLLHQVIYLHACEVLISSPSNWVRGLQEPEESWLDSPNFLNASTHAIMITRLVRSILTHAGNATELRQELDSSVMQSILRSGMVHVYALSRFRRAFSKTSSHPLGFEISPEVITELVEDVELSLEGLAATRTEWESARVAFRVFRAVIGRGDGPTSEELEKMSILLP